MSDLISRHVFDIDTDTGTYAATGAPFNGRVLQTRWAPTTGDTGGDLMIRLAVETADTGQDVIVCNILDTLGAAFTRVFLQKVHGVDGNPDPADTGAQVGAPIVSAGESLRILIKPGGAAVVGKLYIWTG